VKRVLAVVVAVAVYFAGVLLWIGNDKRVARHAFDDYSVAKTSDDGLSLAYGYLRRSGHDVRRLVDPISARSVARGAAVFRVGGAGLPQFMRVEAGDDDDDDDQPAGDNKKKDPKKKKKPKLKTHYVTPLLTDDEDTFVRSGGRIVIATGRHEKSLDVSDASSKSARKVFPLWQGLDTIDLAEGRAVGGEALRNAHAVYAIDDKTAMARLPLGTGDVIVLGVPETFDNAHIAKNLPLLLALTGNRHLIYFDELMHGMSNDSGALELLKEWGLGPFLLLLLVIAAIVFWRNGTRIGEPDDEFRDTRSEAIDLVGSLGALYERTMTCGEALASYLHELTRAVAASSGLRGEALHRRVSELTNGMSPPWKHQVISDEQFRQYLTAINDAFRRVEHLRAKKRVSSRASANTAAAR